MLYGIGMEKVEDVGERETVLLAKRNIQTIIGCRGLQLEIEGAAEAFAQGQSPSFVYARSKRCVDDKLHAAAFVEEAFGDDRSLRRNRAEDRAPGSDMFGGLLGAGLIDPALSHKPIDSFCEVGTIMLLGT